VNRQAIVAAVALNELGVSPYGLAALGFDEAQVHACAYTNIQLMSIHASCSQLTEN
jgi:hypothetical protein